MRLIDADKISEHKFPLTPLRYHVGWNDAMDAIIENAPTIEAVSVVRCRDCVNGTVCKNLQDVEYVDCTFDDYAVRKPYDFCSYGERRADNATD